MSVTREKIMELGEDLIRTRGYNAFSYQDISSELGIKNAAVHYYFPSKENLGTSIVKNNIQRFEEMIQNMKDRGFDEMHQLEVFMKIYVKSNREEKLCIVGALGPNLESLNDPTRIELKKMTELIIVWLTNILISGREKMIFFFRGDAHDRALLILSSLVAGLQLARILDKADFKIIYQAILEDLKPQLS